LFLDLAAKIAVQHIEIEKELPIKTTDVNRELTQQNNKVDANGTLK